MYGGASKGPQIRDLERGTTWGSSTYCHVCRLGGGGFDESHCILLQCHVDEFQFSYGLVKNQHFHSNEWNHETIVLC